MQWGEHEPYLRRLAEKGKKIRPLEQMPSLPGDLIGHWRAFGDLNGQRGTTYGSIKPLRIADIKAWLDLNGYEGEDAIEALNIILRLDVEYRRMEEDRLEQESKSKGKGKNKGK